MLPGSGIHYPGGFDQNTVGEVRGRARGLTRPEHGPVTFRLEAEGGSYTVVTSPAWYWDDLAPDLPDGAEVVVRGSKSLGRDEALYIVAQEVRVVATGTSLVFRSTQGRALWGGGRRGGRGGAQGAGSAGQHGVGGPGGYGGTRRGGRR
ncbi:MAG: OB-fold nucleic acid binding domain-containing protein [Deltaproteobacteria bacterium]|nr:OB-fold nucleic acid binding domain-containing protein [Deltaproteobacteria bacterium]